MSTFDPSKHPRGNAGHAGRFATRQLTISEVSLDDGPPPPPAFGRTYQGLHEHGFPPPRQAAPLQVAPGSDPDDPTAVRYRFERRDRGPIPPMPQAR